MSGSSSKTYTIYIDNAEAERSMDKAVKTANKLEAEIAKIQKAGGDASAQMKKLGETRDQIKSLEASISGGLTKSLKDYQNDVKRLGALVSRANDPESIERLKTQWDEAKQALLEYRANVLKVASAQKELADQGKKEGSGGNLKDFIVGNFLGGGALELLGSAVDKVKEFFSASIDGYLEAEQIVNQFQNTLSKLDRLDVLDRLTLSAQNLKEKIGFIDDEPLLKVFEHMIDFGKLSEAQMLQLLPVVVDFSVKEGIDLPTAAESITKALAGQGKALKGYGIQISEAGTVTDRFNIIMNELKKKVDGAAESFKKTNAGVIKTTQQQLEDLEEETGEKVIPVYILFQETLQGLIFTASHVGDILKNAFGPIPYLVDWIRDINHTTTAIQKFKDEMANSDKFVQTIVQDFASKGLVDQAKLVGQNIAIAQASQKTVNELTNSGKKKTEEYHNAVLQLAEDSKIAKQTWEILHQNIKTPTLGTGDGRNIAEEEAAKKKAEQEAERAKKLADDLKGIATELGAYNSSQYKKDIAAAEKKYDALVARAKDNASAIVEIERLKNLELAQINIKYAKEAEDNFIKNEVARHKTIEAKQQAAKDAMFKVLDGALEARKKLNEYVNTSIEQFDGGDLIKAELNVRKAGYLSDLKARKEYLKLAHDQEKAALNEKFKAGLIQKSAYQAQSDKQDADSRDANFQAEVQHYQKILDLATQYFGQILDITASLNQQKTQKEQEELARDKAANDKKKAFYQKQLDSKVISQSTYNQKVSALDQAYAQKERALKIKEFNRDKEVNIGKAIIATAQAVLQAYAQGGPFAGIALAAIAAAIGAVQIGIIAGAKPPEMGEGGILKGPKHATQSKGMPVTNPETGEVQAYLEGDEGILKRSAMNSKKVYSVTGTPSQIASKLNATYGGANWESGAMLQPSWSTYTPKAIDFSSISQSVSKVRMFEKGGTFATTPVNAINQNTPTDPELKNLLTLNTQAILSLKEQLSAGIYARIPLTEINNQQQRLDKLRANATFKPDA